MDIYYVMRYSDVVSSEFEDNWTTQVRKGVIELCVLNALGGGRLYGYDIVRRLRELDGMFISEGTVYPLLTRLKRESLVQTSLEESPEGPARKYYSLTEKGRRQLAVMNDYWRRIGEGVAQLQRKGSRS
jgi:PadR family transcriptional regulator PadR